MENAQKTNLVQKLEGILRPNETLGLDLLDLLEREGYRFDRDRIHLAYGSEQLYCTLLPTRETVTLCVDRLNNLTVQALNFSAKSGFDADLCFCVRDIFSNIDKNALNNPPSECVFGLFVEWAAQTDLETNPNVVFELLPDFRIVRLRETPAFQTCFRRYLPVNLTIEDLASLILVKKDWPKTPKEALGVFRKKEVSLKSKESRLDR